MQAPVDNEPDDPLAMSAEDPAEVEVPKEMVGQAGLVGGLTLLSRVFGLLRDASIAYVLGTRAAADAFYVAFRIPNLLRRLLAEGNLTMSFVPVFTESLRRSRQEAKQVVDITFTILLLLLTLVTIAGVLGAGWLVHLIALGFKDDPEKYRLTVLLAKISFPYIFFVSLCALAMGILNARRRFVAPAIAPVLLNLGIIFGAWVLSKYFGQASLGVAWGVILGGTLQLLIQLPPLAREGFLPRLNFHWRHPAVRKIGSLMLPSIYGSAVFQINLFAITFLASYLPTGSVSYLWYADRVMEFPLGIFAVSFATVVLPLLSEHAAEKNIAKMKASLRLALATVWVVNIPAAVGLAVLAKPIISVLFFRGDFNQASTQWTAETLRYFALGLPFVSAARITSSAFYAVQEARHPVRAATLSVLLTIGLAAILVWPMKHRGLALAISLGSMLNFLLHLRDYRRLMGPIGLSSLVPSFFKMAWGAALMALGLLVLGHYWDWTFAPIGKRCLYLVSMMSLGMGIYAFTVLSLKTEGTEVLRDFFQKRFARS